MSKALTTEEALIVTGSFAKFYGSSWGDIFQADMMKALTADPRKSYYTVADVARNRVWDWFSGGGASATATCEAFTLIGREEECSNDWC